MLSKHAKVAVLPENMVIELVTKPTLEVYFEKILHAWKGMSVKLI